LPYFSRKEKFYIIFPIKRNGLPNPIKRIALNREKNGMRITYDDNGDDEAGADDSDDGATAAAVAARRRGDRLAARRRRGAAASAAARRANVAHKYLFSLFFSLSLFLSLSFCRFRFNCNCNPSFYFAVKYIKLPSSVSASAVSQC